MGAPDRRPLLNTLLVLGAVALIVAAFVWMTAEDAPSDGREPDVSVATEPETTPSFGPFEFEDVRLWTEWEREQEELAERAMGPAEDGLIAEFHRVNARSLEAGLSESQVEALNEHLVVSVSAYVRSRGPRNYKALGWHLADEFRAALRAAASEAQRSGRPVNDVLRDDSEEARGWRERLGNFFDVAQRTGLADEQGRILLDEALPIVLFRYRWFGFAQDYASLSLMTPTERDVFWRWRIEQASGIPLVQRLAMVNEVEDAYAPRLDADAVRGILYYQDGQFEQARSYFRRARRRHPGDDRYAVWERDAAERARAAEPSSTNASP